MREPKTNIIEFVGTARASRCAVPPIVLRDPERSSLPCPPAKVTIFIASNVLSITFTSPTAHHTLRPGDGWVVPGTKCHAARRTDAEHVTCWGCFTVPLSSYHTSHCSVSCFLTWQLSLWLHCLENEARNILLPLSENTSHCTACLFAASHDSRPHGFTNSPMRHKKTLSDFKHQLLLVFPTQTPSFMAIENTKLVFSFKLKVKDPWQLLI